MRARGCLITLGVFALLILVCCGLLIFVGVPRFRDDVEQVVAEGLGTQIAAQLPARDLEAGEYSISIAELERELSEGVRSEGGNGTTVRIEGLSLDAAGDRLEIGVQSGADQALAYSGRPTAQNGALVMEDMTAENEFLDLVMPADQVGDAIERGVNDYFAGQGLRIASVELRGDELVIEATE